MSGGLPAVTTRKPTKAGQRVWFSCPLCGAYGDCSGDIDATEWASSSFVQVHMERCVLGSAGETR